MRKLVIPALAAAVWVGLSAAPALAAPKVVVSILPIYSLIAGVMQGVAEPALLVPVGASPHNYAMKPSDARTLQSAEIVFWIGEHLENYLEKPLETLAGKAKVIEVSSVPGLTLLPLRKGGVFEPEAEDEHAGDKHDDDDEHKDDKDTNEHRAEKNAETGHAHGDTDAHIWLDPDNARRIVRHAVAELSAADPSNAQKYAANGQMMDQRIAALDDGIKGRLKPVQDRAYIVFHDAYQYFERHFGTKIVGSITVSPDQAPGARRLAELRERIRGTSAVCVFREPQFPAPVVDSLLRDTGAKAGVLDPEGADLAPGVNAYFTLMDRIADSLAGCLKPAS